jgi:hypothetical protein
VKMSLGERQLVSSSFLMVRIRLATCGGRFEKNLRNLPPETLMCPIPIGSLNCLEPVYP